MARSPFPKSDFNVANDLSVYTEAWLKRLAELSQEELRQSIQLALVARQTGHSVIAIREGLVKLCGPKRPNPRYGPSKTR